MQDSMMLKNAPQAKDDILKYPPQKSGRDLN